MAINVSNNNPRVNYTATSGQTVFTVPFEFFASTDLTVYVGGSVLATSAYAVTGGSGATGTVTTSSGQTAGAEIAIVRDVPLERTTDLTSSYSASSLNDQLDRLVTQVADLDDRVSRSISLNDYEVGVSLDLPAKASRLGKTVQFNSTTGALEVGPSGTELTSIASIASEITSLNGIKSNVTTVAGAISNVNSVGSNISSVTSVASSISNVNTVNTNIANVNSVAGSISDLNDVADSLDQVELVGGSISNVDVVGAAISNVNTAASGISNINIVAGISGNVATVAGITSAISTVNSNATNINLVATNIDDVNDVANVITKVTTVADNIANVNAVAPSVGYLSTVANNIANINTLAPISAHITTVAGVASSVSGAAANAAAAEAAKVAAQAAQAAAELAADNFDDTYLGAKANDPTLDNDGDSLGNGDLYFNTTNNILKVYSDSAWQAAALDASGFVDVTGDSMTGNLLFGDGNEARFGTHGDLTIEHDLNNSNIIAANNKPLNITANGGFNINSDNIYFREHAASNTYMEMRDGGGYDHAVRIFHSGTNVRLETTSTGIDVTGTVTMDGGSTSADFSFGDNDKAIFGAGSDLQIYHDGLHSYIEEAGTGRLHFKSNSYVFYNAAGTERAIDFLENDEVRLYFDGSEKLATTSTGINVTGTVTSDGLTVDGITTLGTGAWPTSSIGKSGGRVAIVSSTENQSLLIANTNGTVAANNGATLYLGATATTDTANLAAAQIFGGKSNATSGNFESYLSFKTSASNGTTTERMRITSAGNVGIGTSSPDNSLHVSYADSTAYSDANRDAGIQIENTDTTTNSFSQLHFRTGNSDSYIRNIREGDNLASLAFLTDDGGVTSDVGEAMRITSAGSVGIGTSSPSASLEIKDSVAELRLTDSANDSYTRLRYDGAAMLIEVDDASGLADSNFRIQVDGSEAMRITSSGRVGFGVADPDAGIELQTSLGDLNSVHIANTSSTGYGAKFLGGGNTILRYIADFRDYNNQSRLRVDGSGNLNIVSSSSGLVDLRFTDASVNAYAKIIGGKSGSGIGELRFSTYSGGLSEAMRITSAGDLLVGTTDSTPIGSGGTAINSSGRIDVSRDGGLAAQFERRSSHGSIAAFIKDGSTVGTIGVGSGDLIVGNGSVGVRFNDSITTLVPRTTSDGAADGTISLGFNTARFKDLYLSGGVYLGGTGSANHLDDYEEGTWTPSVSAGSISGTSITYTGTYRKVGSIVLIRFKADNTTGDINVSSYVAFGGLPFACNMTATSTVSTEDIDIFDRQGFARMGSTTLTLSNCGSSSGTTSLSVSIVGHTA